MADPGSPSRSHRLPLSRDIIVRAALAIVDAEGLTALNMRGLGTALGVEAMAVYKHFPNKAAILDGVVVAIFDDLEESACEVEWREGYRATFHSIRALLRAHPNALPLVASRPLTSPRLTRRLASTRDLLLRSRLRENDVLHLLHAGMSLTIGHLWLESGGFVGELPNDAPFLRTRIEPGSRASRESNNGWPTPWSHEEHFDAGLELLLSAPSLK